MIVVVQIEAGREETGRRRGDDDGAGGRREKMSEDGALSFEY